MTSAGAYDILFIIYQRIDIMVNKAHITSLLLLLSVLSGCEQKNLSSSTLEQRTAEIIECYQGQMQEETVRSNLAKALEGDSLAEWTTGWSRR